jgi:tRNA pseudouridine55 synthase
LIGHLKAVSQIPQAHARADNYSLQITRLPILVNGVLIIDKPPRLTSHDVVNRVRRILGQRSVGHLGTLDPMATGVLPLVTGSLTRLAQFYSGSEKSYEGEIRFGFATDTYDADGEPAEEEKAVHLILKDVEAVAQQFQGAMTQVPPPFSAKKVAGVPAYKLARKKSPVELRPVEVNIKEFSIVAVAGDRAGFRARVSSGTYMRSIAHELGQRLGCGGHLSCLRRTAVAEFSIADANPLEELEQASRQGSARELLIHPRRLLPEFPGVTALDDAIGLIRVGRAVNLPEMSKAPRIKVFTRQGELAAIATRVAGTLFHPSIMLMEPQMSRETV